MMWNFVVAINSIDRLNIYYTNMHSIFNLLNKSNQFFSYKLIKDSFKNLTLSEDICFNGSVNIYHGIKDQDVPYKLSMEILNKIKCSQNVSLLLDKEAGHRLSEPNQLNRIIDILKRTLKDI